jgi:uncharacterized protein YuzE
MSRRKKVEIAEVQSHLQSFVSTNRGRHAAIDANEITLVEDEVFEAVNYDPVGKGDALTLTLKEYAHTIEGPKEVYITKKENGEVAHFEVVDKNSDTCILRLL